MTAIRITACCIAALLLWGCCIASQAQDAAKKPSPFDEIADAPNLSRVLLIGDSISIGYTLDVRKFLEGKVNVHRIPENGGDTKRGLESLDKWLGDKPWDVIHFNWGLHDLKYLTGTKLDLNGTQVNSTQGYKKNLEELVTRLEKTGAKLIWASTTPVPEGAKGRIPGDEVKYNAVAEKVMKKHGIEIDDLHALILPRLAELQNPANVHFKPEGSEVLGRQVADKILEALAKK